MSLSEPEVLAQSPIARGPVACSTCCKHLPFVAAHASSILPVPRNIRASFVTGDAVRSSGRNSGTERKFERQREKPAGCRPVADWPPLVDSSSRPTPPPTEPRDGAHGRANYKSFSSNEASNKAPVAKGDPPSCNQNPST